MRCHSHSTLRLWDVSDPRKSLLAARVRSANGRRVAVHTGAFNREGRVVAVGCEGGSIHLFDLGEKLLRASLQNLKAHEEGSVVSCVRFDRDGRAIFSRSSAYHTRRAV